MTIRSGVSPRALSESRARHPSSARYDDPHREVPCSRCGSRSTGPDAVRRVVDLACQLLREDPGPNPRRPRSELTSRLQRVARVRDALHATANRVARFDDDEHPVLDPVRVTAPTASRAVLEPAQLLFQLHLTAGRLVGHLDALSVADWSRTGRIDGRVVTLHDLVEGVVHTSTHDLLDLLDAAPEGVTMLDDRRTRWHRRDSLLSTYSTMSKGPTDATAS